MDAAQSPLAEALAALFVRAGGAFDGADPWPHQQRFCWELGTGQTVTRWDGDRFAGFGAWARTNVAGLLLLAESTIDDLVRQGLFFEWARGPYLYVLDVVIAPGAPRETYRRVLADIRARNPDAEFGMGHMCKRDGRRLWRVKRLATAQGAA